MSVASIVPDYPQADQNMTTSEEGPAVCSQCGSTELQRTMIKSAFWEGERLIVVEDIPAIVCTKCHEQHYDDTTVVLLDLMRGDGFAPEKARRQITVPVFSLQDRMKGEGKT